MSDLWYATVVNETSPRDVTSKLQLWFLFHVPEVWTQWLWFLFRDRKYRSNSCDSCFVNGSIDPVVVTPVSRTGSIDPVVVTPVSWPEVLVSNSSLETGCNEERISWFSKSPVSNAATLPQIRKRPLPSKSFPVHYSLMNVSFEAVQVELPEVPLKEPQIKEANTPCWSFDS